VLLVLLLTGVTIEARVDHKTLVWQINRLEDGLERYRDGEILSHSPGLRRTRGLRTLSRGEIQLGGRRVAVSRLLEYRPMPQCHVEEGFA